VAPAVASAVAAEARASGDASVSRAEIGYAPADEAQLHGST